MKKLITTILILVLFLMKSNAQCFTLPYEGNGVDQMNIYFSGVTVNGANLEAGDVIGIFDGEVCVGLVVLTTELLGLPLIPAVASRDDQTTVPIDGYIIGHTASYRLCIDGGTVVNNVQPTYSAGTGIFEIGATAVVSLTGTTDCANPPAISLTSTSGSTCVDDPITISGNTFTNANTVTITDNGAGSVSSSSVSSSPFSFTYTPDAADAGNTVIITFISDNPAGAPCVASTETYSLTIDPLPGAAGAITGTATVCQGATSVAYSVPVIANATSYTWSYSGTGASIIGSTNAITINFAANATPGNLTVYGVNTCGNGTVSATYPITVNPIPAAAGAITGTATVCQGATSVAYSVPVIANATSYTWSYSGTGASIIGSTNAITINFAANATPGNLTVYGVNTCGNGTVSATYPITVNPIPAAAGAITGTATVCQGATSVAYSVPVIANATSYTWSYSGTGASIIGSTNAITINFAANATPGNLTVYGVNTCGNGTVSATYPITVNPIPAAAGAITGTATVCQGATSVAYSVPVIANATSYTWSYSGTGASIIGSTNAITINFAANATPGNLTVYGVNTCGNGTVSATYPITVNPIPAAAGAITGTATVCQGATSVAYSVPVIANATSYTWSYSGTGASIIGSTNAITINFAANATPGNLTVYGVNTCGNGTVSATYPITVNPIPAAAGAITGTATVCQGATSVAYSVPVIANATSYTWSYSGTGASIIGSTNAITINFAANATPGNLTVYGVNTCGNGTVSATYPITVNPIPAAAGAITGTATVCQGATSVAYSVPVIANATSYTWSYSGTGASIIGSTNAITINFAANATPGNLTVYGVNTCGNGTVSATYPITVNPIPAAAGAITGTATVCQGATSVAYSVPVIANATSYTWSYSGTGASIIGSTNAITINFAANATPGNLTVYGVNTCGNGTVSATYPITVNPIPAAAGAITGTATVCQGATSVAYSVPVIANATSYTWSYSGTGASIIGSTNAITINFAANATPGNLTVYGVNTCGNGTVSATYPITVNPIPAAAGAITGTATVCQGATSVAYSVPVIANATSYTWSYSGTGASIIGSTNAITINFAANATPGNLTVYGVNTCGNGTVSATYPITVNPIPAAAGAITGTATVCQGATSVAYSVPVIANATSYTWSYSGTGASIIGSTNAITINFAANATPGNLTVYGVNTCGNGTVSATYPITVNPIPAAAGAITGTATVCQGATSVAYSVPVIANATSYTWSYSGTGASIIGSTNAITINFAANATPGNLTVYGVNTCGNGTVSATYPITVNPIPAAAGAITGTATVCQGATSVAYSVPVIANATSYTWSYSGTGASIIGSTNAITINFAANATPGNLTVYGVNTCGNGTVSATYPITVNPIPAAAGAITGTATVCQGATSVAYSVPVIANATSYTWSYSGTGASIIGSTNAITINFAANATPGNLTVYGVNTCGNGTVSATYPITVNPIPAAAGAITGTATVCQGATSVAYSVPVIANATSYTWSYSGTGASIIGSTNAITINFAANATPGNLTVYGVNTCGNGTVSATYPITVNPIPAAAGAITGTATVCQGATSVAYSVPVIANATSYTWSYSGTGASIIGSTNAITINFAANATPGNLTVYGVNTCGNGTVSATYPITVNPIPAAAGAITGTATVCQGATSVAYSVPVIANATSYTWSYSGTGASIIGSTNAITINFAANATPGNLTVYGVNTCGNGTVSATYPITVNPIPAAAGAITGTATVCQGATSVAYSVPVIANATSYTWSYSGTGASIIGSTNAITINFAANATPGNLTVYGVNTCGNGTVSATYPITVNPIPAAAGAITGTATVCQGATSVAYSVPVIANATSYTWSYSGTGASIIGSTNAITINFAANATPGNLTVYGVNTCGNGTVSATYPITVNPIPAAAGAITGTATVCQGATSVAYSVPVIANATSYTWSYSGTGASIIGSTNAITINFAANATPGNLTVYGVNTCGNGTVSATYPITVNPIPAAAGAITGTATVCQGATSVAYSVPVIANATSYTWSYSGTGASIIGSTNAITINFAANATPGNLTVYGVNTCGNGTVSATYPITVNPIPAAAGAITGTATVCQGATSVAYSVPVIANATSYTWSYSGTGASIIGSTNAITINFAANATPGNLTVYGVNTCGNGTVSATYPITVNPIPAAAGAITGTATVCQGATSVAYSVPVIANATSYTWSYSGTGASIIGSTNAITINFAANATPGNLTVYGVNTCGNGTVSATYPITVNPIPAAAGAITGTATVCQGATSVAYSVPVIANATSYTWSYSGTGASIIGSTNAITINFAANATPGNLTVYGVNTCGNGTVSATYPITVAATNTVSSASSTPTLCISTALTPIIHTTTGATGIGTPSNLPGGVSASWTSNVITISGTPSASGTFSYSIPLTGGCGTINATGTITVTPNKTVSAASSTPTLCISTALTPITHTTTGAAGIGAATGLPAGVTASWATNTITISGTPTAAGTFNYTIPLTGGCGIISATGTIMVTAANTITLTSAVGTNNQIRCINTAITNITYSTTGATGATFSGLPTGVSGGWASNIVTISGSPTVAGTYNYTVTLTGGCGTVTANGTITVNALPVTSVITGNATPPCSGVGLVYSVTNTSLSTYSWTVPTGANIVSGQGTSSITVNFGTTNGNVTVTETNAAGCIGTSRTLAISLQGCGLDANFDGTPRTICVGSSVTFTNTSTGTTGGTAYSWNFGSGATPGTASTIGPHTVTYNTTGSKTVSLTITEGASNTEIQPNYITVNPVNTITLTSGAGTNNQTVCVNTALANITYATTGATGATFSGFPSGLTVGWSSNVVTISGTPTVAGIYNYTVALTGGCGTISANGTITVTAANTITLTSAAGTNNQTRCINTAITNITYSTTGATGATFSGLPAGVNGSWASNVVTISGIPTVAGMNNYTISLTGGCGTVSTNGTITVTPANTVGTASSTPTLCISTALTPITHTTTGATGIGTPSNLPGGVSASWTSNVITISGTPSASGTFSYSIPLTGGCGTINATGTITVTPNKTVSAASSTPTLCISTALTPITHTTTGATGIGAATGLPAGVTASWATNTITISGTPTAAGTFNYTIPLTGGCGIISATGTIMVTAANTITLTSAVGTNNQIRCINTAITNITYSTTGATGATFSGLPTGVSGGWASNVITISGTPTVAGTYNYTVTLTGGCGTVTANGTITVNALPVTSVITGNATPPCSGVGLVYSVTNTSLSTYSWTVPTGANIVSGQGTSSITVNFGTTNGNVTVTETNAAGCIGTSRTLAISLQGCGLDANFNGTPRIICVGSSVTFTSTSTGTTGGTAYNWNFGSGAIPSTANTIGPHTVTYSTTGSKTVSLTITEGASNTETQANYITVNPVNTITLTSGAGTNNQTVCANTAITTITYSTTSATGATITGLPPGVNGSWAANVVTISDIPTVAGTYNYTVTLTGGCGAVSANGTINVNTCTKTLNLTLFLEGLYNGANGLVKVQDCDDGENSFDLFAGIVADTLTVELAQTTSPYTTVFRQHGVPVNTNGTISLTSVPGGLSGNYHIIIKHRNHVETWSQSTSFAGPTINYNFTNAINKAWGNNMVLTGSVYSIYCGDANRDQYVDGFDLAITFNNNRLGTYGYQLSDINGDGFVDGFDLARVFNNNRKGAGMITPLAPSKKK